MTPRDQIALEMMKLFMAEGIRQGMKEGDNVHMAAAAYKTADIMLKAALK